MPLALTCHGMGGALEALGLGYDAEVLYRRVLREPETPVPDLFVALGWDVRRGAAAVQTLVSARLVREPTDGPLEVDHPRAGLERLIEREAARLELRRRDLDDARASIADFAGDHQAGWSGRNPLGVDAVPPESVPGVVEELLRSTSGVIRSVHGEVGSGAGTDQGVSGVVQDQMRRGRELRSIYPVTVLDEAQPLAWVREWADHGERQRVVSTVPHEFVVFGDEAVVCGPNWGEDTTSIVVVRMPLVISAFTTVFDDLWAGGLRVPDPELGTTEEARLLGLLAAGFKDEAIARHLGVGLRTVRRRVAALMDELGAHTRFQLGVAAERRGQLGPRRLTAPR